MSVCHKSVGDERINLLLGTEASFNQSYTADSANSDIYKNKGTSLCNFS